jgi:hypothetical protein
VSGLHNGSSSKGGPVQRRTLTAALAAFAASVAATVFLLTSVLGDAQGPRDDPGLFVERVVGLVVADDYATAWASLYSAHQRVAPRSEYVACELLSPVDSTLDSVKVVRVRDRDLRIPGAVRTVPVKAVTLRLEVTDKTLGTQNAFSHTFNAVPEGSRWAWILTPSRYELYRDDACGVT